MDEQNEPRDLMDDDIDFVDLDEDWDKDWEEGSLHERWEPRDDEIENLIDHADFEED